MAYVLVQHLDPTHDSILTQLLASATTMPVHEVRDRMLVKPDHVYVIRPNAGMILSAGHLRLIARPQPEHHTVDQFFQSLASQLGPKAIGVILSGTASDGVLGLEAIKAEGGITFAQDEASATHQGMPQNAIAAGCVDFVLPPELIAAELARIAGHESPDGKGATNPVHAVADAALPGLSAGQPELRRILQIVTAQTGVDFSGYKLATLHRRLARRLVMCRINRPSAYLAHLRRNPAEVDALYRDLLIGVTDFFRDPKAFDVLRRKVLPGLFRVHGSRQVIRVWDVGCSTGPEVYSLAILCQELLEERGIKTPVQIFATDLNEATLSRARAGLYQTSLLKNVSPERLKRFFVKEPEGYRVAKPIREMCIFARHNLLSDPPFSRMDLVACRNVLIYMDQEAQRRALSALHYALLPGGCLMLGRSESVTAMSDSFTTIDGRNRIYARPPAAGRRRVRADSPPPASRPVTAAIDLPPKPRVLTKGSTLPSEADQLLLARYSPPAVMIDEQMEILEFRGNTKPYLEHSRGRASFSLMKMLRPELMLSVRALIGAARRKSAVARRAGVLIEGAKGQIQLGLSVIPIGDSQPRRYLVVFEPESPAGGKQKSGRSAATPASAQGRLRRELADLREYLRTVQDGHEAAIEELQTTTEEAQSGNEELQSLNEEMQTSKEELESSNEELTTLNEEMSARNDELDQLNRKLSEQQQALQLARDYAETVIATIREPLLVSDREHRVRTANRAFHVMFGLAPGQVEGKPLYVLSDQVWDIPELKRGLETVAKDRKPLEDLEFTKTFAGLGQRTMQLSIRPLGGGGREDLLLLAIEDVTDRKAAAATLVRARETLEEQVRVRTAQLSRAHAELLLAEERERHNLATDLHDGLCQTLNAISLHLTLLMRSPAAEGLQKPIAEVHAMVQDAGRSARELTFELSPPLLDDLGLGSGLLWLAEKMKQRMGLDVVIEDDRDERLIDLPTRTLLFRAIRELLINAAKHSKSNSARVTKKRTDSAIVVVVEDDGIGFDPSALVPSPSGGFGLGSVRERLNHLAGSMEIESVPGKGTRVRLTVPLRLVQA
jgi:two-component system CheB/CheR fusion protein